MGIFYRSPNLSIAQQDWRIKKQFPQFFGQKVNPQEKIWIGELRPTEESVYYNIKIVYKIGHYPKVTVLKPKLLLAREKKKLPHVYSGNKLCLFSPENEEWTPKRLIADTIIPWTILWLFYYESWLYTGKWEGGGRHPNIKQKSKKKKRNGRIKI